MELVESGGCAELFDGQSLRSSRHSILRAEAGWPAEPWWAAAGTRRCAYFILHFLQLAFLPARLLHKTPSSKTKWNAILVVWSHLMAAGQGLT